MRYVRTEQGVFELTNDRRIVDNELIEKEDLFGDGNLIDYSLGKVIKESDNLIDLCDEAVSIDKDDQKEIYFISGHTAVPRDDQYFKFNLDTVSVLDNDKKLYLCIWLKERVSGEFPYLSVVAEYKNSKPVLVERKTF
jgi:hypothetical protein